MDPFFGSNINKISSPNFLPHVPLNAHSLSSEFPISACSPPALTLGVFSRGHSAGAMAISARAGSALGVMLASLGPWCTYSGGIFVLCSSRAMQLGSSQDQVTFQPLKCRCQLYNMPPNCLKECANPKHVVYLRSFCRRVKRDNNSSRATSQVGEGKERFSIRIH